MTGTAGASLLALALLVGSCVFAALAGPAQSVRSQTQALHGELAQQQPTATAIDVTTDWQSMMSALAANPRRRST